MPTTRALFQLGWGEVGDSGQARAVWNAATAIGDEQAVIDALITVCRRSCLGRRGSRRALVLRAG